MLQTWQKEAPLLARLLLYLRDFCQLGCARTGCASRNRARSCRFLQGAGKQHVGQSHAVQAQHKGGLQSSAVPSTVTSTSTPEDTRCQKDTRCPHLPQPASSSPLPALGLSQQGAAVLEVAQKQPPSIPEGHRAHQELCPALHGAGRTPARGHVAATTSSSQQGDTTGQPRAAPCSSSTAKPAAGSLSFPGKGIKLEIQGPKQLFSFLHV